MVSAVEPARANFDIVPTPGTGGQADAGDGVLDRSAPGMSSASFRDTDQAATNDPSGEKRKAQGSIWKAWLLAGAQRWAKGGGTANKRLDLQKAQAQNHQVKETRTTVMGSGGLPVRNSVGSGGAAKGNDRKPSLNSPGKGPTNSTGNGSGGDGRGGSGGGRGGTSGSHGGPGSKGGNGQQPGGPGSKGGNGQQPGGHGKDTGPKGSDSSRKNATGTGPSGDTRGSGTSGKGGAGKTSGHDAKGGAGGASGKQGSTGKDGAAGKDGKAGGSGASGGSGSSGGSGAGGGKNSADKSGPTRKDAHGHGTHQADTRTPLQKSREIGHKDGGTVRNIVDHVKAYKDGAVDGYVDKRDENAKEHDRLDKAHTQHKTRTGAKTAEQGPLKATVNGQQVTITDDNAPMEDPLMAKPTPIQAQDIDAKTITLGDGFLKNTVSRGELRTFKQYEGRLEARITGLAKVADATKGLAAQARSQATECQQLAEQAKGVKGGEKLVGSLNKLAEQAKAQADEADEVNKKATKAHDFAKAVLSNIQTRYAPLYQAVVDSDETKPAELKFYADRGVTPSGISLAA
jgi:hypothetical protein